MGASPGHARLLHRPAGPRREGEARARSAVRASPAAPLPVFLGGRQTASHRGGSSTPRYLQSSPAEPASAEPIAGAPLAAQAIAVPESAPEEQPIAAHEATALTVSAAGDADERDADRLAASILRAPRGARLEAATPHADIARHATGEGPSNMAAPSVRAALGTSPGRPLAKGDHAFFAPRMAADLSRVRVHDDDTSASLAASLRADAFTVNEHVYFARGRYAPETEGGRSLLAHELSHVAQHEAGAPPRIRRQDHTASPAPAPAPAPAISWQTLLRRAVEHYRERPGDVIEDELDTARDVVVGSVNEVVELGGVSELRPSFRLLRFIAYHSGDAQGAPVRVRFRSLAEGNLGLRLREDGFLETVANGLLPLHHPALPEDVAGERPALAIAVTRDVVEGVALAVPDPPIRAGTEAAARWSASHGQATHLGWTGFQRLRFPSAVNELRDGVLRIDLPGFQFRLGGLFEGTGSFRVQDESWSFEARARIHARGIADAELEIVREDGVLRGSASMDVQLPRGGFSGRVDAMFRRGVLDIEGVARYRDEHIDGEVSVLVTDEATARSRVAERLGAGADAGTGGGEPAARGGGSAGGDDPVPQALVGFGVVDFRFNEWLTGRAEVVLDPDGHITSSGTIRPTASIPILDPPYESRPRRVFSIDESVTVANLWGAVDVRLGATLGLSARGTVGPGSLHDGVIEGRFSTNSERYPASFLLRGTMSLPASAALTLTGGGYIGVRFVGIPLLRTGITFTGVAAMAARVDATPSIEREPTRPPRYRIRGTLDAGAELGLALAGHANVRLLHHEFRPIELGSKQFPLGNAGLRVTLDHVLGSRDRPSLTVTATGFDGAGLLDRVLHENLASGGDEARRRVAAAWRSEGTGAGTAGEEGGAAATAPTAEPAGAAEHPAEPVAPEHPAAGGADGSTGETAEPGSEEPTAAGAPTNLVRPFTMNGAPHRLILQPSDPPVLLMRSYLGELRAKIERQREVLAATDPTRAAELVALEEEATRVERNAGALIRTGPVPASVPGFEALARRIERYAARYGVTDLDPEATETQVAAGVLPTGPGDPGGYSMSAFYAALGNVAGAANLDTDPTEPHQRALRDQLSALLRRHGLPDVDREQRRSGRYQILFNPALVSDDARAHHDWTGAIVVRPELLQLANQFFYNYAGGAPEDVTSEQFRALKTFLHEASHGASPVTSSSYSAGSSDRDPDRIAVRAVEEATTETIARRIARSELPALPSQLQSGLRLPRAATAADLSATPSGDRHSYDAQIVHIREAVRRAAMQRWGRDGRITIGAANEQIEMAAFRMRRRGAAPTPDAGAYLARFAEQFDLPPGVRQRLDPTLVAAELTAYRAAIVAELRTIPPA